MHYYRLAITKDILYFYDLHYNDPTLRKAKQLSKKGTRKNE